MANLKISLLPLILGVIILFSEQLLIKSLADSIETTNLTVSMSSEEIQGLLKELRKQVTNIVPHEYMKKDFYLFQWLREPKMAESRKVNRMDEILDEDDSELQKDYPYQITSRDKEGRPILTANFGDWDLRAAALSGQTELVNRHLDRALEKAFKIVREMRAEGKEIYQWNVLINMENYNIAQQGCLQCLPVYLHFINSYENHFPGHSAKHLLVNTPTFLELVLSILRPLMSPLTRQSLKVYGTNKEQWQEEVAKFVDKKELTIEYGGTKETKRAKKYYAPH